MSALDWDSSFAIAKVLRCKYSSVDMDDISLEMIYNWVLELPDFEDDPALATDDALAAIFQEWYEAIIAEPEKR